MYMQTIEWPGGHKCASMISVNLNAELFWLRFNPEEVAKMPKTLSMGEYGMTNGLARVPRSVRRVDHGYLTHRP